MVANRLRDTESGLLTTSMMTKIQQFISSFLWMAPFICFFAGYMLIRSMTHTYEVSMPSIVGLHINDAIRILSADQLNVRILAETEDPDLAEGTILSQTPERGKLVKAHQSIFLVLSRKPARALAPHLTGLACSKAHLVAKEARLKLKEYAFESSYPVGTCIGQEVSPDNEVAHGMLTIYCSAGSTPLKIFPRLSGKTVDEVKTFFARYDIPVHVQGSETDLIRDQRPLAGTVVTVSKPFVVELVTTQSDQNLEAAGGSEVHLG
jgi:beta-lactam-binding protein with PASTA domain